MTTEATNLESRALNWRRVTRHPALMEYRRLALLVALVNLGVFVMGLRDQGKLVIMMNEYALNLIADMALINLSIGILIRQQRVVNASVLAGDPGSDVLAFVDSLGCRQGLSFWRTAFRMYSFGHDLVRVLCCLE